MKRNSNVVVGLLTNFQTAEEALAVSANSAGSALAENEKVLDSIEGKMKILKATFEELSTSVISSDLVKGAVDAGTGLLGTLNKIIESFGTISTLIAGGGTLAAIAGKGSNMPCLTH